MCGVLALLVASGTEAGADSSCSGGGTMNIVAHPDDDLLFLSPDILHDVQGARCVRTVAVTAGERDGDSDYRTSREQGLEAAYAQMAGVANSWTTSDAGVPGHPMPLVTLVGRPSISLVFMRLPEGIWGDGGTRTDQTLENLWLGNVSSVQPEDGSPSYTSAALTSTLTALMSSFQPDTIRTQDYVGTFGDGDHDDHHATAYFARRAAAAYTSPHTIFSYDDYDTENRAQNVFDPDLTAKKNAFYAYLAYDPQPCGSPPNCGATDEYTSWLKRQYVLASESGGAPDTTPPTVADVAPANGATGVAGGVTLTATFNEAIDTATVSPSTFVLRDPGGAAVAASVTASGSGATLRPSSPLASSTTYTAALVGGASGIKDLAGNPLASDFSWSFTTSVGDGSPPTASTSFPAASGSYNAAGWARGCPSAGLCGTAADVGSGVAKVELSFRRGTGRYWDGTGFAGTSEVWLTAAGTTSWSFAFAASSFPSQGTYTVRVRATDGAGNVGAPTATSFVYDTAAPTSTVTFPVATRSYTTTSWTAGCPTPGVCGTAADAGSGVRSVEISIRRGSGNYWNGTAFGSGAEVYLPAVGTNAWQFAFAASNFPQLKANYTIHVRATDNAGNVRSPSSTKFTFSP